MRSLISWSNRVPINLAAVIIAIFLVLSGLAGAISPFLGPYILLVIAAPAILFFVLNSENIRKTVLTSQHIKLFLWGLLIAQRALTSRIESVSVSSVSLSDIFTEVAITGLVFACCVFFMLQRLAEHKPLRISRARSWLLLYSLFAFASLLWTPNRYYAGFWLIRLLSMTVLIVLYFEETDETATRKFLVATVIGMLPYPALVITSAISGSFSVAHRVQSLWLHPTVATILTSSLGMLFLAYVLQKQKPVWVFALLGGCSFASAYLAGGKSGAFGAGLSLIVLLVIGWQSRIWLRLLFILIILCIALWALRPNLEVGILAHLSYVEDRPLDTMYTRLDLWKGAIQTWLSSPLTMLFGHGFTSARIIGLTTASGAWNATHAHNSVITSLVELGLLGTVPFLLLILGILLKVFRDFGKLAHSPVLPPFVALFVLLVSSMADTVFGGLLLPTFYLLVGLLISIDALSPDKATPDREKQATS